SVAGWVGIVYRSASRHGTSGKKHFLYNNAILFFFKRPPDSAATCNSPQTEYIKSVLFCFPTQQTKKEEP
ncbi:MAG: hypothetical protein IJJ33_16155, partial [Victivallales bacterium]|nr:hypothetical protein [Victivallales bacterium]